MGGALGSRFHTLFEYRESTELQNSSIVLNEYAPYAYGTVFHLPSSTIATLETNL